MTCTVFATLARASENIVKKLVRHTALSGSCWPNFPPEMQVAGRSRVLYKSRALILVGHVHISTPEKATERAKGKVVVRLWPDYVCYNFCIA